jgi:hypothetical protein
MKIIMTNQTITKKERLKKIPSEGLRDEKAWLKLKELGDKISKAWKSKKSALELIKEGRR